MESRDLERINVRITDIFNFEAKSNRVIIAVEVNPDGEVFVLTFGNGIKKVEADGSLTNFISGNYFESPLDFAIDSQGKFFVLDNAPLERRVNVFSATGNPLPSENLGDGSYGTGVNKFRGPIGIAFDSNDNLYIADHYTGETAVSDPSRIKIFYKVNGSYINSQFIEFTSVEGVPLNFPYRIAVSKDGFIFVSDLGSTGKGRVQVISIENGIPRLIDTLEGTADSLGSPGDIVIDPLGYIYIADFGNQVDLTKILNATNDPSELINYFDIIKNGIRNEDFKIRVYSPQRSYQGYLLEEIDLPFDLALDLCGDLYVNNFELSGTKGTAWLAYTDMNVNLDFDLEIYERSPSADITPPVATCLSSYTIDLAAGQTRTITGEDLNDGSYDLCGNISFSLSKETFTEADRGPNNVVLTVMDEQGYTHVCNAIVQVNVEDPVDSQPPVFTNCENLSFSADAGECGAVVNYNIPEATDDSGEDPEVVWISGPEPGDFVEVGETLTVVYRATDSAENSTDCTFTVTVTDDEAPTFSDCPEIITAAFEITEGFEVEDYSQFFPASDNCSGNINYSQNPEPGTIIFTGGDHPVVLTATDAAGNSSSCKFNLQLTEMNTLSLNCTREIRVPASENCEFILPDLSEEFIYFPEEAQISQSIASGEVLTEDTEVVITATYGDRTETCRIRIELVDYSWPELTCPTIQNVTVAPSEGFVLPDYISQIEATDNCGIVNIVQDPAPGTTVTEDVIVTITAEDTFGNFRDCFIYVYLQEDEEGLQISCPADQTLDLEGECSIAIPDYTGLASYSEGATISQAPPAGTSISDETEITLTATLDGEVETCTFNVQLVNSPELIVHCLQDYSEEPDENGYFTLPDYTIFANVEGNCGTPTYTQHPTAGTVVNEDTRITLTATEGNKQDSCDFLVSIQDPESPASLMFTSCPEDTTEEMDADCQFTLPDYTVEAQTNDPDAVISQVPPAGTVVNQDTQITLTATAGSQTATCSFHFDVIDNTPPVAVCVGEFELFLNEDGYGVLSAEIIDDGSYDNCGSFLMTLSKTRFELSDVGEQPVTLTVTDASGNTATCETVVTVSSTDAGVTCPEEMTLALDENGEYNLQLTYSGDEDNIEVEVSKSQFTCADVGRQQTITATYLGEHTGSCEINVTVVDNIPPVISCLDEMEVRLNASGTASISSEDLNIEYSDNCGVANTSLSRLDFTTADVGVNEVTFTVTDGSGNESTCTTRVNVLPHEQGQTEPIKCVDLHVIQIGENGRAVLNPRDLFSGGSGTAQFEVSENTFTCSDLGENTITLNYSTPTEEGSCEITVLVEDPSGVCEEPTSPSNGDYIILYPNPSDGIVRFQTSPGLEIHRVEVFDMRGRFLFERAYDSVRIFDEKLDLREYQSGVYSILIHTNTREFLKRAIIRN